MGNSTNDSLPDGPGGAGATTRHRIFTPAIALVCATSLLASCASETVIRSNPVGAKVFIDGAYVGKTPYAMNDNKIVGSTTSIRLEYPGLPPTTVAVHRSEELQVAPLIAGIFLLVPLLWVMGYKAEHTFDLSAQSR